MQCAEIVGAGQPLQIVTRDFPETPPDGVLLKTHYAGVCHSDIHFLDDELELGNGEVVRARDILGKKKWETG